MKETIKPCPWCGETPVIQRYLPTHVPKLKLYYIECRGVRCRMASVRTHLHQEKADAVAEWNGRRGE